MNRRQIQFIGYQYSSGVCFYINYLLALQSLDFIYFYILLAIVNFNSAHEFRFEHLID